MSIHVADDDDLMILVMTLAFLWRTQLVNVFTCQVTYLNVYVVKILGQIFMTLDNDSYWLGFLPGFPLSPP